MSNRSPTDEPGAPNPNAAERRWFRLVALLVVLYAALDVVAQLLPPHYSAITQAESDLAVGPYGWVMTVNFVVRGVLSTLFLLALWRVARSTAEGRAAVRAGTAFLGIWAVGAFLLAAFPTDVPSTPISWHGAIHLVVALLAFFGGAVGVFALADHFEALPSLRAAKEWAFPLAIVVVVLFVVELGAGFAVPHLAARVGGLTERLFLGSVLLWILLVSVYLGFAPARPSPAATVS